MTEYAGTLDFEDGDQITVSRFSLRGESLIFDLVITWEDEGHWAYNDRAELVRPNAFVARQLFGKCVVGAVGDTDDYASEIIFSIISNDEAVLSIEGEWKHRSVTYKFSGELFGAQ